MDATTLHKIIAAAIGLVSAAAAFLVFATIIGRSRRPIANGQPSASAPAVSPQPAPAAERSQSTA